MEQSIQINQRITKRKKCAVTHKPKQPSANKSVNHAEQRNRHRRLSLPVTTKCYSRSYDIANPNKTTFIWPHPEVIVVKDPLYTDSGNQTMRSRHKMWKRNAISCVQNRGRCSQIPSVAAVYKDRSMSTRWAFSWQSVRLLQNAERRRFSI